MGESVTEKELSHDYNSSINHEAKYGSVVENSPHLHELKRK